ncbi:2-amino-4-hydroxy-6-hydroxymethyldihydropteridinediphosphokinase [Marinospirillum celere]|uniref:2-amino-4-hydroxy-6-hydroxymethyldihydropteridine diphosphokinase n=1 Tax=Marinospirillum celere TaxID=1122252 RepID=A0A1I1GS05_9GAMM|nr:2-amino-4-hydroxy-6-hydroxymethyldihydropteridine diphosphokinase [Marinospirillum celere]SFC14599.1 2-amino-4-hydroxy-6-hydroxymethyldihydropteridinediphosphokinase [Marinospirillum celere]
MTAETVFAWVSLGSNHDRHFQIGRALDELAERFGKLTISAIYETQPVGIQVEKCAPFYNLVAGFYTQLSPGELNREFKKIEGDAKYILPADKSVYIRSLDLDLVTYGQVTGLVEGVELPYRQLFKHDFVLLPLAELAPEELAPGTDKTYAELWQEHAHPEQQMQRVNFTWQGRQISAASS